MSCRSSRSSFSRAVEILEELVDQDGGGLPEGAGQQFCLEQALVALLMRD